MKPAQTSDSGAVLSLEYTDMWGDRQYILEMEGLCSRAGCMCVNGLVLCVNFLDPFFEQSIYEHFFSTCAGRCSCIDIDEKTIYDHRDNPPRENEPRDLALGNVHLIHEYGRAPNTKTRNNPQGSAWGGRGCLNGEAAGWTLQSWQTSKCCSGTSFKGLSDQGAYAIYGVAPYSSDVPTAHVTMGVCLKHKKLRAEKNIIQPVS
ncbi:MAG: hypothetical protein Q9219_003017 [cf. Caloplaca sp. 3 TL-2023]